jgi:hypothetical protein
MARDYKERKNAGQVRPRAQVVSMSPPAENSAPDLEPRPVEAGVEAEIRGVVGARPGLAQIALALARLMDDPKAKNQPPAAAKVLVSVLNELRSTSARQRRGDLAVVKSMTTSSPSA